jgi:hypothetical protein
MIAIHPQYLPLIQLLNNRLFRIPDYQRAYSWTTDQRNDLFADISSTYKKGEEAGHFMASVICLRRGKKTIGTDDFQTLDVVDGQQRLTTLIILLKTIAIKLKTENKAEVKIRDELHELLEKTGTDAKASALLLLQTNHDSTHFFSNYIREGKAPPSSDAKTIADRELLKAIEECFAFVEKWEKANELVKLVALMKNRLHFLLHEVEDEKTVYTVFEVLNSRGMEVSWLDRLKSILMGAAFEIENSDKDAIIAQLHSIWRDIYLCIGLRQGLSTESLRFAATLKAKSAPSRPLGEADAVAELRSQAQNAKGILDVAQFLLKVTQACNLMYANPRQSAVTRIAQARLLAVAMHVRDDFGANTKKQLFRRWENVSFRIYGMFGQDARTRVGDYVRLAWRVLNEKVDEKFIYSELAQIGAEFPIKEAVKKLRNTNCYWNWEQDLRYFMFRYEEHLSQVEKLNFSNEQWEKIWLVSPSDSIEHIAPQSKTPEATAHRLGNLVLLMPKLNSKLKDIDPSKKVGSYTKTGLLIANKVAEEIKNEGGWTKEMIAAREGELLTWAETEWAD